MTKYKKGNEIREALYWSGKNLDEILDFVGKDQEYEVDESRVLKIGGLYVCPGYWITKNEDGNLGMVFNSDFLLGWHEIMEDENISDKH